MSVNLGGWIHSFAVTETSTHTKGYTTYKITSIVFPRSVPEALTCITVWKRFREIKRLYRELTKRHRALHLRGHVPEPKEPGLFKRFEPQVIAERKDYILQLLDFAAQHPALYKSHPFLSFFETGVHNSETQSPLRNKSNIENICDNLDLPFQSTMQMIDSIKEIDVKSPLDPPFVKSVPAGDIENECLHRAEEVQQNGEDCSLEEDTSSISSVLQLSIPLDNDYIYEAAYEFSQAVQAEVNQNYKDAYHKYIAGIDKLLDGSKDDASEDRKTIAKAKVAKYMCRAQEIYEQHLLHETDESKKSLHLSIDETDSPKDIHLERPWNQLSKFKVIQIIDTVMHVQDVTNKSAYIMKTIQKPSTSTNSHSIFLPQYVPYMVRLMGFFQSDSTIFLLLQHAKGGKLFDYIRTYTPTGHVTKSLSEIFTDYCLHDDKTSSPQNNTPPDDEAKTTAEKSGLHDHLNEHENSINTRTKSNDQNASPKSLVKMESIPSFSTLSHEMDVNDLVSCSQKLLQSVTNTLEQYKEVKFGADTNTESIQFGTNTTATNNSEKTEVEVFFENNKKSQSPLKFIPNANRHVILPEVIIKQWARELIIAIESLHLKGLVLGDLHSHNILLGSKGQLLLSYFYQCAGFNAASQICPSARAIEGLYVAPERPLTIKSDWWSFGVVLFELLTGYSYRSCHPAGFGCYYEVQYPEVEIGEAAMDLLNGLLQHDLSYRYQIDQIKSHEFFSGTVWDEVRNGGVN